MILDIIISAVLLTGFIIGIRLMQSPKTAVWGNRLGALSMGIAILYTLSLTGIITDPFIWLFLAIGGGLGVLMGQLVKMIQMPQMVGLLNGFGGAASALVAGTTAVTYSNEPWVFWFTAALALAVGTLTLTGSVVAALKLQGWMTQKPLVLNRHSFWQGLLLAVGALGILAATGWQETYFAFVLPLLIVLFAVYGIMLAMRVGGADMPIVISLLNSFSGIAASISGFAVANVLLVGVGALVGVAGLILTQIMCRAMNRSLASVLSGIQEKEQDKKKQKEARPEPPLEEERETAGVKEPAEASPVGEAEEPPAEEEVAPALSPEEQRELEMAELLQESQKVIIVPGYGMAVAQAQRSVKELADKLEDRGKEVKVAVHPVAGRMPGHMNVLLAEVGMDYDMLFDMEEVNDEFSETDLAIVVGACDVINPAANKGDDSPISGMPILKVEEAARSIILNLDEKPGYSGVENILYEEEQVITYWGDAADTVPRLIELLAKPLDEIRPKKAQVSEAEGPGEEGEPTEPALSPEEQRELEMAELLQESQKVIIVPGYGMAVAQAQRSVKELADKLEDRGKEVKVAVHPVAGRMPGHMNVLLAEVGMDYDMLFDMEEVNDEFSETDLAIVVGACDVINPAANKGDDSPISGMPILKVEEATRSIILNLDEKPGYSGVENILYEEEQVITYWGDAADTVPRLIELLDK